MGSLMGSKWESNESIERLQREFLWPKAAGTVVTMNGDKGPGERVKLSELPEIELDLKLEEVETYLADPLLVTPSDGNLLNSATSYAASSVPTILELGLEQRNGRVVGYREVPVYHSSSTVSTSQDRPLGGDFVRGSSSQIPFTPGGLKVEIASQSLDMTELLESLKGLGKADKVPGFNRGIKFKSEPLTPKPNLSTSFKLDVEEYQFSTMETSKEEVKPDTTEQVTTNPTTNVPEGLDSILQKGTSIVKAVPPPKDTDKTWAFEVNLDQIPSDYSTVVPHLAHPYPFELDPFQKHAVYHLESGNSVFVAAHTSAGKTVVAEYAIALATQHMTKVIYTSPIKALSNQKFRDFSTTFSDVGLLTGDVQINPEASCLIMTTEILRSMLYRGADLIRDVEFVIFDEIHYLNDADRGVVWEEVIIMLPPQVTLILLSATVPNTREFAEWIGRTKQSKIYVISTKHRPIPLEHHIYADKELFKIVDSKGTFLEAGYKACKELFYKEDKTALPSKGNAAAKAKEAAKAKDAPKILNTVKGSSKPNSKMGATKVIRNYNKDGSPSSREKQEQTHWVQMIGFLKKKQLLPVIVFTFSKRICDLNASHLTNVDLNSSLEKSKASVFINHALRRLAESDRNLPQIVRLKDLLLRGIAVHHSGLLPVIKEIVEILFSRNLVKVLFATETFAMGVNMPARSVVFNGVRKHDGQSMRYLLPGEYTQMSGRAGRRGLDSVGMVIINCPRDGPYDSATLRHLILGKSTKLASQFRLTYNMILNLLRVEALKVEEMIQRSFAEDSSQKMMPQHLQERDNYQRQLDKLPQIDCAVCNESLDRFLTACMELNQIGSELSTLLDKASRDILCPGRVVVVDTPRYRNCLACIIKPISNGGQSLLTNVQKGFYSGRTYLCYVLTNQSSTSDSKTGYVPSLPYNVLQVPTQPHHALVTIDVGNMIYITTKTLKSARSQNLQEGTTRAQIRDDLTNYVIEWSNSGQVPYLTDRPKNLDVAFIEGWERRGELLKRLSTLPCRHCSDFMSHYSLAYQHRHLKSLMFQLNESIAGVNLELLPEYYQRLDVLQLLKHSEQLTITLKGRIACEINTVNELIVTELLLDNFFASFSPEEAVALLSSFLCHDKTPFSHGPLIANDESRLTDHLVEGCEMIVSTCYKIAEIQNQCGLTLVNPEFYCEQETNFGLVGPVYEWARGMSFNQITTLTDVAEGSIVRCITRLDDACRDVRNAARLIGDPSLYTKMEEARLLIQRDIVFATSLYI